MATDPMLAFRDIKKSYGDNVVLAGVNFEVQPGEIVALSEKTAQENPHL